MPEELLRCQQDDGEALNKLMINWKKDGPRKRTSRSYLEGRRRAVDEVWVRIRNRHLRISSEVDLDGVDEKLDFDAMKDTRDQLIEAIEQALILLDSESTNTTEEVGGSDQKDRDILRGERTRAYNILKEYVRVYASEGLSKTEAEIATKELRYYFALFVTAHEIYLSVAPEQEQSALTSTYLELSIRYRSVIDNLTPKIADERQEYQNQDAAEPLLNILAALIDKLDTGGGKKPAEFKLPTIEIPKFDGGSPESWLEFHDMFTSLVHNKSHDNIIKMTMLKNHVEGSAANVIAHFTNSGNNYESAWEILCNRYHNEKKIILHLLNKMFSLKVIHNESAQELTNLADSFKNILHFLKNLKEPVNEWNSILIFMLTQRLPMDTLSMWEQSCEDSKITRSSLILGKTNSSSRDS